MNATEKAASLAQKYVGNGTIVQIDVRGATDPHLLVKFQHRLSSELRKEITQAAEPFRVRFKDTPLSRTVEK